VTGAAGYVGGAIVSHLLGQTSVPFVNATVRGDVSSSRYDSLRALDTHDPPRLRLFSAELVDSGAYDEPCRGCHAVIHVAAPTTIRLRKDKDAYEKMIEPGLRGIDNVVSSVEKMGLRTLVLTSSFSAVQGDGWERGRDHVYSENDWNISDTTPKNNAYACMKVRTEKRCWELYEGREARCSSWETLYVFCPGLILGKPKTDTRSEMIAFMELLMQGRIWPVIPNYHFTMVHLDDVVRAHVLAALYDAPGTSGRYGLAYGKESFGMKDVVCGRVKRELRSALGPKYTRWFPICKCPKWVLWILSLFLDSIQWPLVRGYLDKKCFIDGSRVVRDVEGFIDYRDPLEGFVDLLIWVSDRLHL
jgi:nucleoside-diphosphate-sugar epimerase